MNKITEVMLVGSVPLADARAVMNLASSIIGKPLTQLPDGETGPRSKFISWQEKVFEQVEQLEVKPLGKQSEWGPNGELPPHTVSVRDGATGTPKFPPTGYGAEAVRSYATFVALKAEGKIAPAVKFQVGMPTPLGVLSAFGNPKFQEFSEPAYRQRMKEDVAEMARNIPHNDLVIQWDLPLEIAIWEGHTKTYLPNPRQDVVSKLVEMLDCAPADVNQGLHICYGDVSHKHWKEPDLDLMVEFSNAVAKQVKNPLSYIHYPIPRSWLDAENFKAFTKLNLNRKTKIFLGLLHQTDGLEGAEKRIAAARKYLPNFGLATSCGLGRRKPADLPAIFQLHKDAAGL